MTKAINWNRIEDPVDKQVWDRLTANFWLDTKIPVSNDLDSWRKLTDNERTVVKKVFAILTSFDTLQSQSGAPTLGTMADTPHSEAVFTNIAFMESVHAKSYSTIFSTLCSSEEIDNLFRWVGEDETQHWLTTELEIAYSMGTKEYAHGVSVLLESMLFYTGFYAPLRLAAEGRMTNTADIIRLILRDEGVHGYYIGYKFQKLDPDTSAKEALRDTCRAFVEKELLRIEDIYDTVGWTEDVKNFLRYNANKALANLGLDPLYSGKEIEVSPFILAALDPGTGEAHDFFSGSGASYVIGATEELQEEDWDF